MTWPYIHTIAPPTTKIGTTGGSSYSPEGVSDPSAQPNNGYGLVVAVVDGQDAGKRAELR